MNWISPFKVTVVAMVVGAVVVVLALSLIEGRNMRVVAKNQTISKVTSEETLEAWEMDRFARIRHFEAKESGRTPTLSSIVIRNITITLP